MRARQPWPGTGHPFTSQLGQPFDLVSGSVSLTTPPQPINTNSSPAQVDTRIPTGFNTLVPYDLVDDASLQVSDKTGDIVHRYWHEQVADQPWNLPEGQLAQQYTLCDNFFHAAFGGSFLNHQFLIAAAAPVYPNAPASMQARLDATGQLALDLSTGKIVHDGNITPIGGRSFSFPWCTFDKNYAVNTIFSANLVPTTSPLGSPRLLPSQNDSNPNDTLARTFRRLGIV